MGHHQNGTAVRQEMQRRFPDLGTRYPTAISAGPTRKRETEEEITWCSHVKIPPLSSKFSTAQPRCGWIFSLLLCPNPTRWLRLLVIALDFLSDFTDASSSLPHIFRDASFFLLSLCESQRDRLEAAVAVWFHFIDAQRVMTS